jgi:hypothetical protein
VCCFVFAAAPVIAQSTRGSGKAELTIIPGGWVSFAKPDVQPEPSFGEYIVGGSIAFNPGPIGIEGELVAGLRRTQDLAFGTTTVNKKSPPVFIDSVSLVVPVVGRDHAVVPYVTGGISETTINRTRDVGQQDTETFVTGNVGGGVKWYSEGRWGFRADYRFYKSRSEFNAPGNFFGRVSRTYYRFYGALTVKLIPR